MNIEPLELRIAPAAVFTFTDVDGDTVTLTTSKGTNAELAAAATVVGGNLRVLNLTAAVFQETNVSTSVSKGPLGDGLVNIGRINATGIDLGAVSIKGDLGDIDAGMGNPSPPALKSLSVRSLGYFGLATQGGAGDLTCTIVGKTGSLTVAGDVRDTYFRGIGGIGAITIGGSLLGGAADHAGAIEAEVGDLGAVKIGRDLRGGDGLKSGYLFASGKIASVSVAGSILGGDGESSGAIRSTGALGAVKVGGDLRAPTSGTGMFAASIQSNTAIASVKIGGSVVGGGGDFSGHINCGDKIGPIAIGGSLTGGFGDASAWLHSTGDMGLVKIGGSMNGVGLGSARIDAEGKLAGVTVGGSLVGGSQISLLGLLGTDSAGIASSREMGPVSIGGDLVGLFAGSAKIAAGGKLTSVTVRGSLIGSGFAADNARISTGPGVALGPVTVGGSLVGGDTSTATIISGGTLAAVKIGGDLRGGFGSDSAVIDVDLKTGGITIGGSLLGSAEDTARINVTDTVDFVKIGGDLRGGDDDSASVRVTAAKSVTIGGSLLGNPGFVGAHFNDAYVAVGTVGTLTIRGSVIGGSATGADSANSSGTVFVGRAGSIALGGDLIAGQDQTTGSFSNNGSIRAFYDIGALSIAGNVLGNGIAGFNDPAISARGQQTPTATKDVAIGSLTIGGRVESAHILGGVDISGAPVDGNAQFGAVKVGGDWIASTLVTGLSSPNALFADGEATATGGGTISRIASIVIAGQVFAQLPGAVLRYGFGAGQIGSFSAGGVAVALTPGAHNDTFAGLLLAGAARAVGSSVAPAFSDARAVHVFEV